ncbi:hypothetical protein BDZ88DRAFT_434123 [Geranomyces variabilis]|nr:hypothetical protein BDZ88DRAFT_434123 [Geranomyces variabilis]KAJ3136212.1 hypothetical protein HDU90_003262 [Geranomyces variabilis]
MDGSNEHSSHRSEHSTWSNPHAVPHPHPLPQPSPEEAIAIRKRVVDAKFGPGSWEKSSKTNPHRCNGHLEDWIVAVTTWPMDGAGATFSALMNCFWSEAGKEPPRRFLEPVPFGAQRGQKRGMWWGSEDNVVEQDNL